MVVHRSQAAWRRPSSPLRAPGRRVLTLCIVAACAAHPGAVFAGQDNGGTRQHAAGAGGAGSSSPGGGGAGGAGSYYALNFFGYGANGTGGTGNGGYNPGTNGSNGLGGAGGTAGYTTGGPSEFLSGAWNGTAGGNGSNPGSGGGGGGVGIYFVSGNQQIDATASTRGGDGGTGADDSGGGAGGGGGGGSGAALTTGAVLLNYSTITGGNGGASGRSTNTATQGAGGGGGGAGVWMAPTTLFTNRGTVTGGNGGIARDTGGAGGGGAGIVSDNGGASIVNYGTVIGGLSGTGVRAHAFDLYGGNNVLALSTGTSLTGDVYAYGSSNELRLDGSGSTTSNVSGFDVVSATTNATWALNGAFLRGGSTRFEIGSGASATLAGAITGGGDVTKNGAGTLTLSGSNTYTGTTTLNAGGLALTQSNNARAPYVVNGGTLQLGSGTYNIGNLSGAGGSIVGPGVFNVQESAAATYAGDVSVTSFQKTGAATLTLTGNVTSTQLAINTGTLQLTNTANTRVVGGNIANQGTVAILGTAATTLSGNLSGAGNLTVGGTGPVSLGGNNSYTGGTTVASGSSVRATSSSAFGSGLVAGAQFVLDFGADDLSVVNNFSLGSGVNFNVDAGRIGSLTGTISDISGLTKTGAGTLVIDGHTSNTVTTTVDQGTLTVGSANGSAAYLAGDALVLSGATLAGHGRVDGDVTVTPGGTISPGNSVGTLTVGGDLTMQSGSSLRYELGSPGADFLHTGIGDRISVGGDASFDDVTLDLIATPGFGAGVYRLFDVGGAASFTNGGLQLGTTPANSLLTLRYLAADHAIDLLNTQGTTLSVWNANGLASASTMGGGNGTWSLTSVNFTDATGSVTAPMSPQPGFGVFGGAAGTVTLEASAGDIAVTGLQVMSDGYRLTGAPLTLAGDADGLATVRVGDGSAASANLTATIDSVIEGNHGLTKTDAGTLVLTADNTWSGGVAVDGGTLSIARDVNLGDTSNAVTLDGGVLRNTAAFTSDRHVAVGSGGGGIDTTSDLALTQGITGNGVLHKLGAGTLVLTGANTYSGGTSVDAGTLVVGDGAHAGSLIGSVVDNATLVFDRADDVTFDGALSGAGQLVKRGAGSFAIADGAAFTGTTRVDAGTLDLRGTLGGSVTLANAAALTGQGAIGALVASNGSTISIAGDGTTGSLQVTGNVTLAAASRYVVTATPTGASDLIAANGNATLQGALVDARFIGTTLKPSTRYTILTATGGVNGTFGSVTVDKPFLTPSLSYGTQAVYLELDRNDVDFATLATNQNARATATAIQSQDIGGALFDTLAVLDYADVMPALDSLTGAVYASSRSARTDDARQVRDTVQRHLDATSDGQLPGNGAWTATWGRWGDVGGSSTIGFERSRSNGGGLLAGVDRELDGVRVGALGGAGSLSTRSGNDSVNAKSRIAGVYASAEVNAWQLSAGATYAWQRMDAHRGLDVPGLATQHASARYDGNLAQGWLDAGYRIALSGASLTPFANVARVRTQQDGFTEQQADAALVLRGTCETTTVATLGLRSSVSLGDAVDAHAKLGYQRAYGDLTPIERQRFLDGGDTFVIQGAPLARNAGIADLGVNFAIGRHTTVGASYQGRFGGGSKDQGARLDVAVRW